MPDSLDHIWTRIEHELRASVSPRAWRTWLSPLSPVELSEDTLVLSAPDEIRPFLSDRFQRPLQAAAASVLGPAVAVALVGPAPTAAGTTRDPDEPRLASLNPKFTFEQFVLGEHNRLAHAAALAVAEQPGQAYNPLFIYGAPGLGKTHLLHAIGNYVERHGAGMRVRYTTIEAFTADFVGSLRAKTIEGFKRRYRDVDVLLVDDVQMLERKARTEEEFFHLFNELLDGGRQLVLTSDKLPQDLGALENRLRDRFASGLVTSVRSPDRETRLTILRKRTDHDGLELAGDDGALERIADRVSADVRTLEGALIRVAAHASLYGEAISPSVVDRALDDMPRPNGDGRPSVAAVQAAVAAACGIELDDLLGRTRTAAVARARQVAMYLAKELTDATTPSLGRQFGGRSHTTVLHAHRAVSERIAVDPEARALVDGLCTDLSSTT